MAELNILLTSSCQNDYLEPLDDSLLYPLDDELNMNYEGCQLMWQDYFKQEGVQPTNTDITVFIDWLRENMFPVPSKNAPYEKIIEKYGHRVHLDANETKRFWHNNDFVKFIDSLYDKAKRINDSKMNQNYHLIHLRDWYDTSMLTTNNELNQFGIHCLKGTKGAGFIKPLDEYIIKNPEFNTIINTNSLSAFLDTDLDYLLNTLLINNNLSKSDVNIGIIGAVTNVKVFLMVYELVILHEFKNVYVCEDFVAAFSPKGHIKGIYDMKGIFGVNIVTHKDFYKVFDLQ